MLSLAFFLAFTFSVYALSGSEDDATTNVFKASLDLRDSVPRLRVLPSTRLFGKNQTGTLSHLLESRQSCGSAPACGSGCCHELGDMCCPDGEGCCPPGFFCDTGGCCPIGEICTGSPNGCPDPTDNICSFGGCCPAGETCVNDTDGLHCEDSGNLPPPRATTSTRTSTRTTTTSSSFPDPFSVSFSPPPTTALAGIGSQITSGAGSLAAYKQTELGFLVVILITNLVLL